MKKTIVCLVAGSLIFFAITSYKNAENSKALNALKSRPQTIVTNVTDGITTTIQYFAPGGLYTTPTASINGQTVTLTNYAHSTGTVYLDKFRGQINGEDIDVYISGYPYKPWRIFSVTVTQ